MLELHVALGDGDARAGARLTLGHRGRLRLLEGGGSSRVRVVSPHGHVVGALLGVVAREQALVEIVAILHEEGGVGVVTDIFVMDEVLLQHVVDEPAEEGHVRARADPGVDVADRRGPSEPRIDVDDLGPPPDPMPRLGSSFAFMNHWKPTGCASAGLAPLIRMTSACLMSRQWFVIAPRPNVAARLTTVGPCQTRACCSMNTVPRPRMTLVAK